LGGNFAVVKIGDVIHLDVSQRKLTLDVSAIELEQRKKVETDS
jgi:dihydroxyacid dehydratase/phosphogluconate dehydratase